MLRIGRWSKVQLKPIFYPVPPSIRKNYDVKSCTEAQKIGKIGGIDHPDRYVWHGGVYYRYRVYSTDLFERIRIHDVYYS